MRFFHSRIPSIRYGLRHVIDAVTGLFSVHHKQRAAEEIFNTAYTSPVWGSTESLSGTGSELRATITIRKILPQLLKKYRVTTFLDAPCGDWNWISQMELPVAKYIGVDIVPSVIDANNKKYANEQCTFQHCDITQDDLPRVDFVLCRDCLVHLSNQDIISVIKNFKHSGIVYLCTNNYPDAKKNYNQFTGLSWRELNLFLSPFNFPEPLETFDDGDDVAPGKMSIWRLDDISIE